MHRSGTSILASLVNKLGLNLGSGLLPSKVDNPKGFYERIDVMQYNNYMMLKQGIHYCNNTYKFDSTHAIRNMINQYGFTHTSAGHKALAFLNNPTNYPWMLKDPRLCITIKAWLPVLHFTPVIIFTYRHPLDVALSMSKRELEKFKISKGLRLWYVYNRRAIEQTNDLCRIITSHQLILKQPKLELDQIFDSLNECGLQAPNRITEEAIQTIFTESLLHSNNTLTDLTCQSDLSHIKPPHDVWQTEDENHFKLYREVMRVYCSLENKSVFSPHFKWDYSINDDPRLDESK
eukprot:gene6006-8273_t